MIKFNLKKMLFDRDMSQMHFHRKTGIRYATVNNYCNGFVQKANIKDIDKMCEFLECTVADLIEYIPNKK